MVINFSVFQLPANKFRGYVSRCVARVRHVAAGIEPADANIPARDPQGLRIRHRNVGSSRSSSSVTSALLPDDTSGVNMAEVLEYPRLDELQVVCRAA